jgi:hypothetical protein
VPDITISEQESESQIVDKDSLPEEEFSFRERDAHAVREHSQSQNRLIFKKKKPAPAKKLIVKKVKNKKCYECGQEYRDTWGLKRHRQFDKNKCKTM